MKISRRYKAITCVCLFSPQRSCTGRGIRSCLAVTQTTTFTISETFIASHSDKLLDVVQMALDSWLALSADVQSLCAAGLSA